MSQGPLYPNLSQKVQKEVSQMANRKLSCAMLYRWFKCKLKPPKNGIRQAFKRSYRTIVGGSITTRGNTAGQKTSYQEGKRTFLSSTALVRPYSEK